MRLAWVAFFLVACCCTSANAKVTFDWATVGNPGNAPDTRYDPAGFGGVDHTYRISKHEVTNAQYMEFLNAVATVGDPFVLYSGGMASTYGGIDRTGAGTVGDPYVYSVKGGDNNWLDRPVNYVSFFDAMRFTNWLHNGQGSGDTESGAYTIGSGTDEVRSASAKYWIPSEDEWYKAAYYDPNTDAYFDYPTSSNTAPGYVNNNGNLSGTATPFADGVTDPGNYATYDGDGGPDGIGSPYYMTSVGEWENSTSPYGTFDQGGNVWEWNEAVISSSFRGLRGGSFLSRASNLHADYRSLFYPALEGNSVGFRVATVPEPSTMLLGALAVVGLLMRRRF
ncbi:MAG: SUMF1/EgtB/PvdO family nonheme iron enzyme [Planctomycetales bacterium]|nr:SUMF1/EgtB/PvdO family nonheme iron enzyme [Planctomycetales bacterium]